MLSRLPKTELRVDKDTLSLALSTFLKEPDYLESEEFASFDDSVRSDLTILLSLVGSAFIFTNLGSGGLDRPIRRDRDVEIELVESDEPGLVDKFDQDLKVALDALKRRRTAYALELLDEMDVPDDPKKRFRLVSNKAVAMLRMGRAKDAEALCRDARKLRPDDPGATSRLSASLLGQGRADEALEIVNTFLDAHPGDMSCNERKIEILGRLRRTEDLTELLNSLGNLSEELSGTVSLAYFLCGDLRLAESYARDALKDRPDDVESKMILGEILSESVRQEVITSDGPADYLPPGWRAQLREANSLLAEALRGFRGEADSPQFVHCLLLRSVNFYRLGELEDAKSELALARQNSEPLDAARVEFQIHAREGNHRRALHVWSGLPREDQLLGLIPMAAVLLRANRLQSAIDLLRDFEDEIGQEHFPGWLLINYLAQRGLGNAAKAEQDLERLEKLVGAKNIDVVESRVSMLLGQRKFNEAAELLEGVRELDTTPELVKKRAEMGLANVHCVAGNYELARQFFQLTPEIAENSLNAGRYLDCIVQVGDFDSALEVSKRVLARDPQSVPALRAALHALKRFGDYGKALECADDLVGGPDGTLYDRLQRASCLIQLDRADEAKTELIASEFQEPTWKEAEYLAQLWFALGEESLGLRAAFRSYRLAPSTNKPKHFFISLCSRIGEVLAPKSVEVDTSVRVQISGAEEEWWHILSQKPTSIDSRQWLPEEFVAQQILGAKLAEVRTFEHLGRTIEVKILEILPATVRAFRAILSEPDTIASVPSGIRTLDLENETDRAIAAGAVKRELQRRITLESLVKAHLPPVQIVGTKLDLPRMFIWLRQLLQEDFPVLCCAGVAEERLEQMAAVKRDEVVLDASALCAIALLGWQSKIRKMFRRIVISPSTKQEIAWSLWEAERGAYQDETATKHVKAISEFVARYTEVVPLEGLSRLHYRTRLQLEAGLGKSAVDSGLLADQLDLPLWSDEFRVSAVFRQLGLCKTFWTQAALNRAHNLGHITDSEYVEFAATLTRHSCSFVWWTAQGFCLFLEQNGLPGRETVDAILRPFLSRLKPFWVKEFVLRVLGRLECGQHPVGLLRSCQASILDCLVSYAPAERSLRLLREICLEVGLPSLAQFITQYDFSTLLRVLRRDFPFPVTDDCISKREEDGS